MVSRSILRCYSSSVGRAQVFNSTLATLAAPSASVLVLPVQQYKCRRTYYLVANYSTTIQVVHTSRSPATAAVSVVAVAVSVDGVLFEPPVSEASQQVSAERRWSSCTPNRKLTEKTFFGSFSEIS